MSALPDVDVIIVARGSAVGLESAVASVEAQVEPGRVVIVDTQEAADAVEAVRAAHPDVRVVPVPPGTPGAAVNAGIAATSGESVLLLDVDGRLEERGLAQLVGRMRSNRSAAIVAPVVTDADGDVLPRSFGQFPTTSRALVGGLNRFAHTVTRGIAKSKLEIGATLPVDWASGACMLVRRAAIHKAGPMDESFVASYADVEWCHRMRAAGLLTLIEPTAACVWVARVPAGAREDNAGRARQDMLRYCRIARAMVLAQAAGLGYRLETLELGED